MKYISSVTLLFSILSIASAFEAPRNVNPKTTYALTLQEDDTHVLESRDKRLVVENVPNFNAGNVGSDNGRKFIFPDDILSDERSIVRNLHAEDGFLTRAPHIMDGKLGVWTNGRPKDIEKKGIYAVVAGAGIKLRLGTLLWVNKDGTLGNSKAAATWMLTPTTGLTRRNSRIMGKRQQLD